MTVPWETVHIFISSTFNDMHAERDYLVKQVFPELREWCEKRKLRLVDIDLRWGVTEQDATSQNVVKVCLDRIDDCRPFFLCFLGQRRGWVPQEEDISTATKAEFPALGEYAGKASVTEMEILHAVVNPLHRGRVRDPKKLTEFYEPSKYAFFYLREDSYLDQLPPYPPQLRHMYTNEAVEDKQERELQIKEHNQWRDEKIPALGRPVRKYQAHWNPNLNTPELLIPLRCPSTKEKAIQEWQKTWRKAGVTITGVDIESDPTQAAKAHVFNTLLSTGRLTDFQSENQPLSQVIISDLQAAITARYPDHYEIIGDTDLQKEIDQQEQFVFSGSQGFIERGADFDDLDAYFNSDSRKLFVLTAQDWLFKKRPNITYAFIWIFPVLLLYTNYAKADLHEATSKINETRAIVNNTQPGSLVITSDYNVYEYMMYYWVAEGWQENNIYLLNKLYVDAIRAYIDQDQPIYLSLQRMYAPTGLNLYFTGITEGDIQTLSQSGIPFEHIKGGLLYQYVP